jgi:hypothetical protein
MRWQFGTCPFTGACGFVDAIVEMITGAGEKNAGLKAVTLIAALNPVSQVLW